MSLGFRLSPGPGSCNPGEGIYSAETPVGGCFWPPSSPSLVLVVVKSVGWEEGECTAFRGRQTGFHTYLLHLQAV